MSDHTAVSGAGPQGATTFVRESANGVTRAFVLLAMMLTLGLIAFGPVGPHGVEAGFRAAFAAAIFGNITAVLYGEPLLPNEVPRASSVLVFAAFIARLATDPMVRASPSGGVNEIFFLAASCLAFGGLIQVAFGLLRLGNIARFVPYPVVAGLMTGLAFALVFYELPEILGTHGTGGHGEDGHGGLNPWTVLLALVTIGVVVVTGMRWPHAPAKLVGGVIGTAIAALIAFVAPSADLGAHVPYLVGTVPLPDALLSLLTGDGLALVYRHRYELLVTAPTIAIVGSVDSLLATVGESDGPLDTEHDPSRLLVALGMGNILCGLFGGVPLAYASTHTLGKARVSAPKALGSVVTSLTLLLLLLYGAPLLQQIPIAVLSAIMLLIAIGLIDRWAGTTLDRLWRRQYDRELVQNLVLVLTVAAVTVIFGLVPAVVTGLVLSMALFIAVMNVSLVRSVATGETRASRRVYPPEQETLLRVEGHKIRLIELDGALFFGTADRLGARVAHEAQGARYLILDLRRVTMIDASGALMLERLSKRLRQEGTRMLLAHISATHPLGRALLGAGVFTEKHHPDWFTDTDRALEWAERQLLSQAHVDTQQPSIELGDFALMAGLSPAELRFIKAYLDRQLFPAHAALFREGEHGDRLYLLAKGAVSIVATDPASKEHYRRVVTLAPGVMFGESAMLQAGTRFVTAIAEEESVTYTLSRANLEAIRAVDPDLYQRLLLNVLEHLSGLLRMTTGVVRQTSDAVD